MKIETECFFIIYGFFVEIESEKSEKRGKKVEKHFWMQKSEVEKHFWTTSDGKIFLDYKSYEEKKTTSNLAQ